MVLVFGSKKLNFWIVGWLQLNLGVKYEQQEGQDWNCAFVIK